MNPVGVANPRIIPDNRITSSSHHGLYQAAHGRLYSHTGGAWCSRKTDSDSEWLQVDIGEIIHTPTQKQNTNSNNNELNLHSLRHII